jgi:hypothetical protein
MTNEQIINWVIEFGTDWVPLEKLESSGAGSVYREVNIIRSLARSLIEMSRYDKPLRYRLTPKAIAMLEEGNEVDQV